MCLLKNKGAKILITYPYGSSLIKYIYERGNDRHIPILSKGFSVVRSIYWLGKDEHPDSLVHLGTAHVFCGASLKEQNKQNGRKRKGLLKPQLNIESDLGFKYLVSATQCK